MTSTVRARLLLAAGGLSGVLAGQLVSLAFGHDHALIPLSVQVQAAVQACPGALLALGLVLVYRSTRIINFAQTAFGGAGAIAALVLVRQYDIPYFVAVLAGVAGAAVLGGVCEVCLVRRFSRSSRLVLTVATIGVAQLVIGAAGPLIELSGVEPDDVNQLLARTRTPLTGIKATWFPIVFTGDHLLLVAVTVAVLIGLGAFFRFARVGVAIRASAENADRAELLGVHTGALSTLVWVLAATLSGIAAAAQLPFQGLGTTSAVGISSSLLLAALAAAVLGRLEHLPTVVVSALSLGVFGQSVFWAVGRTEIATVVLFVVLLVGLLLQRGRAVRGTTSEVASWASAEEVRPVPPELASLDSVRRGARWVKVAGVIMVLGYPWIASTRQVNLGGLFAIYGIVAVSLVILVGWGGQISLGQWAFAAIGAVVAGSLTGRFGWPFPIAFVAAALCGAGLAVVLGLPALRIRGLFLAVTTLSFALVVSQIVLSDRYFGWMLPASVPRPRFLFLNSEDERVFYYLCIAVLAAAVLGAQGLRKSRTGRVLIAMRDNERTAQALGVSLVRTRIATFALSGCFAASAGALFACHQHAVRPESFLPDQSVQMFSMAIIGGLGSIVGVLAGPLYLGLFSTFLVKYAFLASAVGVLLVLLFVPGGLGALGYSIRDAFLRRVAIRHKIFVPSLLADHLVDGAMSKVPLAPHLDNDGKPVEAPGRYRLPSRIALSGASQAGRAWTGL